MSRRIQLPESPGVHVRRADMAAHDSQRLKIVRHRLRRWRWAASWLDSMPPSFPAPCPSSATISILAAPPAA